MEAMRRLAAVAALLLSGCRDGRPAAIRVDADPFLLNGPGPVQLPVRVVAATGRTLVDTPLTAESAAESVATVVGGALRCHRHGDARIALAVGALSSTLLVQCRPVASFAPFTYVELEAGGPPGPIPVVAYSPTVRRVSELRFSAAIDDTTVAIVRDGLVVPRALGNARVRLDFGGLATTGGITVVITERVDTVALAAGEYRQWPLTAGRYRISGHAPDGREAATGVQLRAVNANCARDRQSRETIHCVVADSARVVALAPSQLRAVIRIVRMPE